ncbi:LysR family transcriptional regulator [Acetobacter tropicalis]|nr:MULTISPECIES: LysR family transcriptional regulator [Acetobacter]ATJ91604.1 LysR family transcriptional regulator [Acetobacter tropicalis]KXV60430.1 LysR family transcriptional regulator [Acetobacter senegalensis]MCC6105895.1 LysR family transcriptional regulator [Acetobacter sp.]MCG4253203.1 LysR family transcriptional regulator [Acetobacter senegalensis]MCG4257862.1 LysR family transcriptional regulator [Acetobacter senegalensis]
MPVFSRFLRYFMAVAQHGSIRKASDELHIAASAIDRQILQGEKMLGTLLFERLPTGLRLTTAGELLLTSCRRWTRDMSALTTQIDNLKGLRQGSADIVIPDALTKGFIPTVLGKLRESHPGITVNIHVRASRDMGEILVNGDADFALMFNPGHMRELYVRAHKEIPLGFITLPDHPVAAMDEAYFSLCAEYPVVVPAPPLALWRPLELLEAETGMKIQAIARADNIQMIKSLVSEGVGIGILSYLDAYDEIQKGQLAFVPLRNKKLSPITLALCVDRSRQLSMAARLIISEVEQFFVEGI